MLQAFLISLTELLMLYSKFLPLSALILKSLTKYPSSIKIENSALVAWFGMSGFKNSIAKKLLKSDDIKTK